VKDVKDLQKDLKAQLKDWKTTHPQKAVPVAAKRKSIEPPASPPQPKLSDAELFAKAVAGVERDAALQKFGAAPVAAAKNLPPKIEESDAEMFSRFAAGVERK
jgi:hypothetical protein